MNIKLFFQAITKFILGVLVIGLLLFIPANTIYYWNGWLFMGLLFVPMFIAGIILMIKNPELLRKRLNAKEKENEQKQVIAVSGLMFLFGFIIAGLNYKYNWIVIPNIVVIISSILFILAYILYAEVLRENTYLSRTIEVQENQKVIDTGLYGIVRHPMYAATILLFLTMPLILGSIVSFVVFLVYPIIISKRIKNEEKVLEKELLGYAEYKDRVKYKVIPFVWQLYIEHYKNDYHIIVPILQGHNPNMKEDFISFEESAKVDRVQGTNGINAKTRNSYLYCNRRLERKK